MCIRDSDETLSLEETQAIYRKCRERGMVICEQIVPENGEAKDSIPVSYTHLDVYKRQSQDYLKLTENEQELVTQHLYEEHDYSLYGLSNACLLYTSRCV